MVDQYKNRLSNLSEAEATIMDSIIKYNPELVSVDPVILLNTCECGERDKILLLIDPSGKNKEIAECLRCGAIAVKMPGSPRTIEESWNYIHTGSPGDRGRHEYLTERNNVLKSLDPATDLEFLIAREMIKNDLAKTKTFTQDERIEENQISLQRLRQERQERVLRLMKGKDDGRK